MNEIQFAWDDKKAGENRRKHKISFGEAKTVFYDENARLQYAPTIQRVRIDFCYSVQVIPCEFLLFAIATERRIH